MKTKSNLLLFLVITTILLTSPLTSGTAFADNNDDKKNKKTFEQMCAKKKGNEPDALFCRAILGLQHTTDSFFDVFTELRLVDLHLQDQIDSFFDVFVELDDVADKQCPQGQVATGTNLDGSLLCTDITQNQDCDDGYYVSGIDDDGKIKCKPLPSDSNSVCGDNIITAPETCDDGNTANGDGCSAVCQVDAGFSCVGNPSTCSAVCDDGIVAGAEQCDGTDFGGLTCEDFGHQFGSLHCTPSCTINANSCIGIPL